MSRPHDFDPAWDEEPIGIVGSKPPHRWAHERNVYITLFLVMGGIVGVLGSLMPVSPLQLAGALGILLAAVTTVLSDRAGRRRSPAEQRWMSGTLVLVVVSVLLWLLGTA